MEWAMVTVFALSYANLFMAQFEYIYPYIYTYILHIYPYIKDMALLHSKYINDIYIYIYIYICIYIFIYIYVYILSHSKISPEFRSVFANKATAAFKRNKNIQDLIGDHLIKDGKIAKKKLEKRQGKINKISFMLYARCKY